jgi:hypothetical protein
VVRGPPFDKTSKQSFQVLELGKGRHLIVLDHGDYSGSSL